MALNDQDLLKMIRKLISESADTSSSLQPWQELSGRNELVQPRNIQALEAVSGFVGSWASAYTYLTEYSIKDGRPSGELHTPIAPSISRLGQPGLPEIDFVPYSANTNQFGSKGPALIGHPISFEIVGPTAKSADCEWLWHTHG